MLFQTKAGSSILFEFIYYFCSFTATAGAQAGTIPQIVVSGAPVSVEVADLNGDGANDLVVAAAAAKSIVILMNDGTGHFQQSALPPVTTSAAASNAHAADLNGDGKLDIVASFTSINSLNPGGVIVYLGDGTGGFALAGQYLINIRDTRTTDFDGDGDLDIVALAWAQVDTLINSGTATFSAGPSYAQVFAPFIGPVFAPMGGFDMADLDSDGRLDFAVPYSVTISNGYPWPYNLTYSYHGMLTGLGDGAGGFAVNSNLYNGSGSNVTLADFNADGKPDFVMGGVTGSWIVIAAGLGNGAVGAEIYSTKFASNPAALRVNDINQDGIADLLNTNSSDYDINFRLGTGAGTLGDYHSVATGAQPMDIEFAAIDASGQLNCIVANRGSNTLSIVPTSPAGLGNGKIRPFEFTAVNIDTLGLSMKGVHSADLDLDGNRDLVMLDSGSKFWIFRGSGAGSFINIGSASPSQPIATSAGGSVFALADFNNDGRADLLTSMNARALGLFLNNGGGGFGAQAGFGATSTGWTSVAIADLDFDGNLDAIVANTQFTSASSFRGDGAGGFIAMGDFGLSGAPNSAIRMAVADFNNNGAPDVVAANDASPWVFALLSGDGAGGFLTKIDVPVPGFSHAKIDAADFNNDGNADLIINYSIPGNFAASAALVGNGDGTFQPAQYGISVSTQNGFESAVADLNFDGRVDGITSIDRDVIIQLGNGSGGFSNWSGIYSSQLSSLECADVDSNGRLDLILAGSPILLNSTAFPVGVSVYGTGTPGCGGIHGLAPLGEPKVGNPQFGVICTNAPPNSLGIELDCDAQDPIGSDFFYLGTQVLLDINHANYLSYFDTLSDRDGYGVGVTYIPNDPQLIGMTSFSQVFWYDPKCPTTWFGLTSSRGLAITIQAP
ncbi:MAG: VCBS repeat-containing protein [Planctomycetes bacterium]|nr:VCBS repeat-containing protein [Planctomycetota bacterium]